MAAAAGAMRADWPCSAVRFDVEVTKAGARVPIVWSGVRVRLNVTVTRPRGTGAATPVLSQVLFVGDSGLNPFTPPPAHSIGWVPMPPTEVGNFTVTLTKVSTSAPFGTCLGAELLGGSQVTLYGLGAAAPAGSASYASSPPQPAARRIQAIGGSDTAGYCVDGLNSSGWFDFGVNGWKYENCGEGYVHDLGASFDADVSVQAISGIGLIQNANAAQSWQMGNLSMPGYHNRTVQMDQSPVWDFVAAPKPDIVLISLGGNDYNHQHGNVPSNATFTNASAAFLDAVFSDYGPDVVVAAVCGMGDPTEKRRDPDNYRCRPCPHVEAATAAYVAANPSRASRTHYLFVPCDGSVVTGVDDIGCNGHKNRKGQSEVAASLRPRIAAIMGWK